MAYTKLFLKVCYEEAPQYHVIAAGSLLGITLHKHNSFPVGKVDFLDLHPLSFSEFLEAVGQKQLLDLLKNRDWKSIKVFKKRMKILAHLNFLFLMWGYWPL